MRMRRRGGLLAAAVGLGCANTPPVAAQAVQKASEIAAEPVTVSVYELEDSPPFRLSRAKLFVPSLSLFGGAEGEQTQTLAIACGAASSFG